MESALLQLRVFRGLINASTPPVYPSSVGSAAAAPAVENVWDMLLIPEDKPKRGAQPSNMLRDIGRVCVQAGFVRREVLSSRILPESGAKGAEGAGAGIVGGVEDVDVLAMMVDVEDGIEAVMGTGFGTEVGLLGGLELGEGEIGLEELNQMMDIIREAPTQESIDHLVSIALSSTVHVKGIVDCLLHLLQRRALTQDLHPLSLLCTSITSHPGILDLIFLLHHPRELLEPLETFCNEWRVSTASGMMSSMMMMLGPADGGEDDVDGLKGVFEEFGKVWVVVGYVVEKFEVGMGREWGEGGRCFDGIVLLYRNLPSLFRNHSGFCYRFFAQTLGDQGTTPEEERFMSRWLSALFGNDGISDDLIRSSDPQTLITLAPILFERSVGAYQAGQIEYETLQGGLDYFQEPFLSYVLVPGVVGWLSEEIVFSGEHSNISQMILRSIVLSDRFPDHMARIVGRQILNALDAVDQLRHQEHIARRRSSSIMVDNDGTGSKPPYSDDLTEARDRIMRCMASTSTVVGGGALASHHGERTTTSGHAIHGAATLFYRTQAMFHNIAKSGRSKFMRDYMWDEEAEGDWPTMQHFLDVDMCKMALEFGGARWFVSMIVEEVLEAGKSGGAIRATELGASLLTTPLIFSPCLHNLPANLLRTLLVDAIPLALNSTPPRVVSYFQGQILGVFVGHCLVFGNTEVAMVAESKTSDDEYGIKDTEDEEQQTLGGWFLENVDKAEIMTKSSVFSIWNDGNPERAVGWKGFVKGLKSHELLREQWVNVSGF
ncbi:mediator complex subunit Med5-domain-containing protein [Jimgerdemannia flammicorona]|uniref:Mediator of RNA polymerase II transcription subunit 5 n=1 Tax=Jimgerdemannia flammicorona TaxID=994334 RepID=A0A433Q4Z2_9FUNG|nr:mediator complex subunit Med5-domain-containing protein [Jimgerdemannia flammicorona]